MLTLLDSGLLDLVVDHLESWIKGRRVAASSEAVVKGKGYPAVNTSCRLRCLVLPS